MRNGRQAESACSEDYASQARRARREALTEAERRATKATTPVAVRAKRATDPSASLDTPDPRWSRRLSRNSKRKSPNRRRRSPNAGCQVFVDDEGDLLIFSPTRPILLLEMVLARQPELAALLLMLRRKAA